MIDGIRVQVHRDVHSHKRGGEHGHKFCVLVFFHGIMIHFDVVLHVV